MIGAIEDAILARLKLASDNNVLGYKYADLDSYPTDWDVYLKESSFKAPAVWVVCGGWSPVDDYGDDVKVRATFGLVVAAQNIRNEKATRHGVTTGTGKEVGTYQMVIDAVGLLQGRTLGLPIDPLKTGALRFVRPTKAILERKISMMGLQFETVFTVSAVADPDAGALGDFETFDVVWDFPPHGSETSGPSPDRHDTITLPIQEPTP